MPFRFSQHQLLPSEKNSRLNDGILVLTSLSFGSKLVTKLWNVEIRHKDTTFVWETNMYTCMYIGLKAHSHLIIELYERQTCGRVAVRLLCPDSRPTKSTLWSPSADVRCSSLLLQCTRMCVALKHKTSPQSHLRKARRSSAHKKNCKLLDPHSPIYKISPNIDCARAVRCC